MRLLLKMLVLFIVFVVAFQHDSLEKIPTATIDNYPLKLFIAKTDDELRSGLSGRRVLPKDTAMLFLFEKSDYHAFWMQDMHFPIDIIFLKDNHIVKVYQNALPPSSTDEPLQLFKPEDLSDMVLEVHAGFSKEHRLQKGDVVTLKNL